MATDEAITEIIWSNKKVTALRKDIHQETTLKRKISSAKRKQKDVILKKKVLNICESKFNVAAALESLALIVAPCQAFSL